jgi:triosephosphate isomerase
MSKRKKCVFGNWKMNLTNPEVRQLSEELSKLHVNEEIEVGVFPVYPYISLVKELLPNVRVGAQNFYPLEQGAFTGEVSVLQIKDAGADMVLIGHSERRTLFHEDHAFLRKKVDASLAAGIMPVFCCGEPFEIRQAATEKEHVRKQLEESLFHVNRKEITKCVIAYEPVWAIGTGLTATSDQAEDMHCSIRSWLSEKYGAETADGISILYGGSCNASNAAELFACPNVDGGLIGGASLKSDSFMAIIDAL